MKHVAVGALLRNGLVLACRRRGDVRYPLKWEFPGGKIEPGEDPAQTLTRELREELNVIVRSAEAFHRQEWVYRDDATDPTANGAYRVTYYRVREFDGDPVNVVFDEIRWVTPRQLLAMDILEGNREAVLLLDSDGHTRDS